MSAPKFQRLLTTNLYLADDLYTGVLVDYVKPPADGLSVADVLTQQTFLFVIFDQALPKSPTDQSAAAAALVKLRPKLDADVCVAWISNVLNGATADYCIHMKLAEGAWQVAATQAPVVVRNLALQIAAGSAVTGSDTNLNFALPATPPSSFTYDNTSAGKQASFDLSTPLILALIDSDRRGGFFDLGSFVVDKENLQILDPAQRFFVPNEDEDGVDPLAYPLFDYDGVIPDITLQARLHCFALTDPDCTYCQVSAADTITAGWRNAVGDYVQLSLGTGSKFAFGELLTSIPDSDGTTDVKNLYLAPVGRYDVALDNAATSDGELAPPLNQVVLMGASGVEYFKVSATPPTQIWFIPGKPAYAPLVKNQAKSPKARTLAAALPERRYGQLEETALTSWVNIVGTGINYYAQPDSNVLFGLTDTQKSGADVPKFLTFASPIAGTMPIDSKNLDDHAFPMAPLAFVSQDDIGTALALENQILAPKRRSQIPAAKELISSNDATPVKTTTPQGLLLTTVGDKWQQLDLAKCVDDPTGDVFTTSIFDIKGKLQKSFQSNQLFQVISDKKRFLDCCDLSHTLEKPKLFHKLRTETDIDTNLLDFLEQESKTLNWPVPGRKHFHRLVGDACKKAGLEAQYQEHADALAAAATAFKISAAGWTFDLSPDAWAKNGTILVFKFSKQSLKELLVDKSSWTEPDYFNTSADDVQDQLINLVNEADENDELIELRKIANDKFWTGILAINVTSPLEALPDPLKGLAAGINPNQFKATFVAVPVTPIEVQKPAEVYELTTQPSSIDVLLNYVTSEKNPERGPSTDYDYLVASLRILIESSSLSEFSSSVLLFINRLFGQQAYLEAAPYIELGGYYREEGNQGTYVFINELVNQFGFLSSPVIQNAVVDRVRFFTVQQRENDSDPDLVETRFMLDGTVAFRRLQGFDAYSFGPDADSGDKSIGLRFRSLSIDMSFYVDSPTVKTFTFNTASIAVIGEESRARDGSLYQGFPMRLVNLVSGNAGNRPDKTNFMLTEAPFSADGLDDTWFGMLYEVNLGSPGALAAAIDFTAQVIVAWSPSESTTPKSYIGLSIPGVKGGSREIPLQGVLKFAFGNVGFVTSGEGPGTSYVLQLRRIALKLLALTLPPGVEIDCFLFGDPTGKNRSTVGWYACVKAEGADIGGETVEVDGEKATLLPLSPHSRFIRSSQLPELAAQEAE